MRVLHIINSLVRGGAESLLVNSLKAYCSSFTDEHHFIITIMGAGPLKELIPQNVPYCNFRTTKWNFIKALFNIRNFIHNNKIEIVHSHLFEATIISRLSIPKRVHLVSTYHNGFHNPSSILFSKKRLWIDQLTYRKRFFTVFVSNAVKSNIVQKIKMPNNQVVPNFPDISFSNQYSLNPDKSLTIISVGGLKSEKNYSLSIKALSLLKNHKITLHIYGEGPLKQNLQNEIKKLNANVLLMGDHNITSELLSRYDLYLMASITEGMPLALLEALSTGLPAVLSDIPELRETAQQAALYFQPNNFIELTTILKRCYLDKNQLLNLSGNSIRISQNYNAMTYVNTLHSIYKKLSGGTLD